jgi:hypothetical protein
MKRRDKLDRYRTPSMAVATMKAGVPFWITLTPNERRTWSAQNKLAFNLRRGPDRKRFRDFIRDIAGGGQPCHASDT